MDVSFKILCLFYLFDFQMLMYQLANRQKHTLNDTLVGDVYLPYLFWFESFSKEVLIDFLDGIR